MVYLRYIQLHLPVFYSNITLPETNIALKNGDFK